MEGLLAMAVTNTDIAQMLGRLEGTQAAMNAELERARSERKALYEKVDNLGQKIVTIDHRITAVEKTSVQLVETIDSLEALPGAVENLKALAPVVEKLNTLRMKTVYVGIGIVAVAGAIGYIASLFVAEIKAAIIRIFGG